MAPRDELIHRISLLPEEALEDVARYIDQVMTAAPESYKTAHVDALHNMQEGIALHLDTKRLTREELHERP